MSDEKQNPKERDQETVKPAGGKDEFSEKALEKVSGGMQWEYTKQDDTGAAKGTMATKINLAQVDKDRPRIVNYLKTDASWRQIDLHPDVADYLRKFMIGRSGLILQTKNGTPYLYGNLAEDWLDQRLAKLGLYEAGMGWHSFKRFRNSWLRAPAQRCQEDLRKF